MCRVVSLKKGIKLQQNLASLYFSVKIDIKSGENHKTINKISEVIFQRNMDSVFLWMEENYEVNIQERIQRKMIRDNSNIMNLSEKK